MLYFLVAHKYSSSNLWRIMKTKIYLSSISLICYIFWWLESTPLQTLKSCCRFFCSTSKCPSSPNTLKLWDAHGLYKDWNIGDRVMLTSEQRNKRLRSKWKHLSALLFFAAHLNALFQPKRSGNFGILWVRENTCLPCWWPQRSRRRACASWTWSHPSLTLGEATKT